ncbi:MAG TPA: extracellular solute-binding protein [Candidatus Paceibacterota bacterium]
MKNISTFQAVLMGVFGVFALIGIFVFATYSGSSSNKATVGTVVIWGELPKEQMTQALATMTQSDQTLQKVSYIYKDPATFETELTSAIASGEGPDLVLISQEDLGPLMKELTPIPYTSLPQRTFTDTFSDACSIYLAPEGIYGIPVAIDPLMLYYNRTMLSSASIAAPPATWEALTGLVPQVTEHSSSQNISRALVALGTYDNVHDARGILSTLFLQAGVPIVERNAQGRPTASLGISSSVTAPGESVVRFYTQFADPSKVSYTWNVALPDSLQMFTNGDSALYLGYASEASFIAAANPNLSFDMAPVPQLATASFKTDYARVYALALPRGSANQAGALLAASTFSKAANEQIVAAATKLAPALRSLLAAPPSDPIANAVYPQAIMARAWLSPAPAVTDQIFSRMILDVVTGRAPIAQALASAEQLIEAQLSGVNQLSTTP